jgi:class 3 adenylate cyclase/DNA-binding winged helix-turn-helix (wHTH) protein/tetratricopeptide (TPR) repeat protein
MLAFLTLWLMSGQTTTEAWENSRSMLYRFYDYTLDPASREVRHGTHRLALEPKVFQVLLYLLEHRDRMVPKAELFKQCWPEAFVSESALTRCLARLRKAIQPTATAPPVIKTLHRQGYRFVAEVTVLSKAPSAPGGTAPLPAATPAVPLVPPDTSLALAIPSGALGSGSPALRSTPEAERRQLTIMFCDIVDSTILAGRLDPEDFRAVMVRYHATCTTVIERYGGHVAQYLGDGLLVYFGWPRAHEDDARRAVHAGMAVVTAVRDLGSELVQNFGIRLAIRIGMDTGLVVVGAEAGGTPYGQLAVGATPNLAAKIQGLAAPETIVISATTYALVQGYFLCDSLGEHYLPGTTAPSVLYQVRGASGARGRLDLTAPLQRTPFVGREVELAVLRERAAQVRQGLGQVVLLSGEAGIGKSRLVQEVTTAIAADGFTCLEFCCSPYAQHTALHPVIEWLQRCIQDDAETPGSERLACLEAFLHQVRLGLPERLPLVAALLSLPLPEVRYPALQLTPQQHRQRTLETLVALLLGRAEQQPVLLVVEDLHWSDPTTLEWLGLVMDQGPTAPIFTLLTCRPTFASPWGGRTHVTLLAVHRLASQQVTQMVQWLGEDRLSAAQRQHIVTQTDGIPLFVEEVTKLVLAAHQLHGHTDQQASASAGPAIRIPVTLQDSLMARLDQLGPAKSTAQLGATIGRVFPAALLWAVTPLDEDVVRQDLKQLVDAELLYQRGVGAAAVYLFKHALIQEAAYASLLRQTRQHYHQHITQVLETQFPDTVATQPELLAHHALCGEAWDKALTYSRQAGEKAMALSAYSEAVGYFEQAISVLPHLPETRDTYEQAIALWLALHTALLPSGDPGRMLAVLREAETLAVALDDPRRLGQVSDSLSLHFYFMGAYDQAIVTAQRALALASASGDIVLHARANRHLGFSYHVQGDYRRAIDTFKQTMAFFDGARRHERFGLMLPTVQCRAWLAWCHAELGMFAEGRVLGEEGLRIAEAIAHPASLMAASWGMGLLALRQGALSKALPLLERAVGICQEAGIPSHFPLMAAPLGAAYTLGGRIADAVPLLTQAVTQTTVVEMRGVQALCSLSLGEAQLLAGGLEEAHALAERTLAYARAHQERGHQAYALHLLGEIAAHRDSSQVELAEAHFSQALALADDLGMRPFQAHCHHSLGTLYRQTGRDALARAALSTAIEMYRAMDMTFWLPQAEAALA